MFEASVETVASCVVLLAALSIILSTREQSASILVQASHGCHFSSIYNFGDSNSDTGGISAGFGPIWPPHGETFFGKPAGRVSDGRLMIDFIAEKLGLPLLSSYLDAIEGEFQHGANFAAIAATIQPLDAYLCTAGYSAFTFAVQTSQFEQFKNRTIEIYSRAKKSGTRNFLPKPKSFSTALFTVDIGQNDIHAGLVSGTEEKVKSSIPNITDRFSLAVEKLYKAGARAFWIHNTSPLGCSPWHLFNHPPKPGNVDASGCIKSYNEVVQEFNKQLKEQVSKLRNQFRDAMLIYVDIYSAKYSLISQGKKLGFPDPFGYCCGKVGVVHCGKPAMVNGTQIFGNSCSNPSEYIFWDGLHYTEAANKWVVDHISDGSYSQPHVPLAEACYKPS